MSLTKVERVEAFLDAVTRISKEFGIIIEKRHTEGAGLYGEASIMLVAREGRVIKPVILAEDVVWNGHQYQAFITEGPDPTTMNQP